MTRLIGATLAVAAAVWMPVRAQTGSLDDVVKRLVAYSGGYGPQLADVVAEEYYTQQIETERGAFVVPPIAVTRRVIRSDYVLTQVADGETWVAFRDAFEVDGAPVRDRANRLAALLSRGGETALRQAAAIANESARFNIGSGLITRNINVPTFVIQLMRPESSGRFRFSRARSDTSREATGRSGAQAGAAPGGAAPTATAPAETASADGRPGMLWQVEFRERDRPTIVRRSRGGGDQPLRGTVSVDPGTGEIWASHLTWERGP